MSKVIEIRNIRYKGTLTNPNSKRVYAELYIDGELAVIATLEYVSQRAEQEATMSFEQALMKCGHGRAL